MSASLGEAARPIERPPLRSILLPGREAWLDLLLALVLALLPLLFFWRMLLATPDQRFTIREGDFTQEYFPLALVAARAWRDGEWPIWNPLTGGGQPLLADPQTALLYPLTWLVLPRLEGPDPRSLQTFQLLIPLHFALAGLGSYALGRVFWRSRTGALVTALTYAYSGFLISYPTQQVPILRTAAWLPFQALGLGQALERRSWGWAAVAGVATALSLLAGHPQTALFHLYALALLLACWCWAEARRDPGRALAHVAGGAARTTLALAVGFLLASPQLLATLEFTRLSTRSEVSFAFLANGFSPRELLMGMLAPRILGGPPPYVGGLPAYVGVLPLLLALVALALGRGRFVLFGAALAGFGLLLSMGGQSALFSLLYLIAPGFSLFRGQERGIELFAFATALLAGCGASRLAGSLSPLDRRTLRRAAPVAALAALLALALLVWLALRQSAEADAELRQRLQAALDSWGWCVLMLSASLVVLRAALARRGGRQVWTVVAPALVALDLLSIAPDANLADRRPEEVYRPSAIVRTLLAAPPPFRLVDQDVLNGHHGLVYGLPAIEPGFILKVRRYEELRQAAPPQRLFDLLDGRYLVTRERHDDLELILEEPYADQVNRLYRLPDGPGRAWFVREVRHVPDARAALTAVLDPNFRPAEQVVLEGERRPPEPRPAAGGTVLAVSTGWSRTWVEVETDGEGYLVVSQVAYPGWSAFLDGTAVPLLTADYALVAVRVPSGRHQVELAYWPTAYRPGLLGTGLGLLLAAAAFLVPLLRARKARTGRGVE